MKISKPLQTNLSKIDGFLKPQPPKNKKEVQNYVGFLTLFQNIYTTYKSFFDRSISNSEKQQILNGLLNYNKHLIESKKNSRTEHSASQSPIEKNASIFCAMPLTTALEKHSSSSKKNQFGKMELVSANSRLFSSTELRLSTTHRECSAIIYARSKYEFLIQ